MPLSGRNLTPFALILTALALGSSALPAHAATESEPIHTSGDKQLWHRKENIVELIGHAVVSQPGETLTADYVTLDRTSRVLDAKGNCVYVSSGSVIYGDEMHFNLDTRTGTVVGGRISNQKFTLSGERINKLGEGRFQTHWGEYTTCVDCPNAWSLLAEDVDMQVEGYAFMSNVTTKVDDSPAFWLPYMIVPMKTRRQTGLLFPTFSVGTLNGLQLVLPFFWAINRSADMTVSGGVYSSRGPRLEWEGRYALSSRSGGRANLYYLSDKSFTDAAGTPLPPNRYALDLAQTQELPWGFNQKARISEVSDNLYPTKIGDVPGAGDLNLPSTISLDYASPEVSGFAAVRRYRTLVNTLPDPVNAVTEFDPRTVQEFPAVTVGANDRQLFRVPIIDTPVVFGLNLGMVNFTRSGDAFDYDSSTVPFGQPIPPVPPPYHPGVDPIRKGMRLAATPSLYTTFRPFDAFAVTPSLRYFYYWYTFPQTSNFSVNNLNRAYLLFQTDLSAQLERIYEYPEDKDHPKVKHLIRPLLTFSYIPPELERQDINHPFLKQIQYATDNNFSGYNFDDYDIVPTDNSPLTANYFIPLGYSLNTGITTQWIRRNGAEGSLMPSYVRYIEATAGEAINFREYEKGCDVPLGPDGSCSAPHNPQPLSRFFTTLDLNLGKFNYSNLYYWYPYVPGGHNAIFSSVSYALSRGVHQGIYKFDRSITLSYNWDQHGLTDPSQGTNNLSLSALYSLSDYFLPSAYLSYNFVGHDVLAGGLQLQLQSPARCWQATFIAAYDINTRNPASDDFFNGFNFHFDLALNLTGTGFGGITEMANTAIAPK